MKDITMIISTGSSRKATVWPNHSIKWSEFVRRISEPVRTSETYAEYIKLPKSKQDELKDVGGFVGGEIRDGGRRKADSIVSRALITLDADTIPANGTEEVLSKVEAFGCAYAVYSTRKHCSRSPRLRIVIPTAEPMSPDEYEPAARKVAELMGVMPYMDPSTFEPSRLMYWPSCSSDGEYVFRTADKPYLNAGVILDLYADFRNATEWPEIPGAQKVLKRSADRQGDPETKTGIVGAFCRTYDIEGAMAAYLPDVYTPCDLGPGRYTYTGGSTSGGAVLYQEGKFLYSHHATDPCSGRLVNAFDLVRLHKFSDLDDEADPNTPTIKLPSYLKMTELATQDDKVRARLNEERLQTVREEFGAAEADDKADYEWAKDLIYNSKGKIALTIENITLILFNDPYLKDIILHDEFGDSTHSIKRLPWHREDSIYPRDWTDTDDAGLRYYLEKVYGITGKERIYDAFDVVIERKTYHPLRDYLKGLKWDSKPRMETVLIDYLGAQDTPYVRAVARKALTAAVARVMQPGTKFDYAPILVGPQGIGKTTFLRKLGGKYHTECAIDLVGKNTAENIQGFWIVEMGELKGFSKAEAADMKQFLSKTEDTYRGAYQRRSKTYPRQCVFFGTTNDYEFLKDMTGNRRFWPVDVWIQKPEYDIFKDLTQDVVDQIWAEAYISYTLGAEDLYLSADENAEALEQQEAHKETDPREGMILGFVQRRVPLDWHKRSLNARRMYWADEFKTADDKDTVERDRICVAEVWCELFNGDIKNIKRADALFINNVLSKITGWEKKRMKAGEPYGFQRGYMRGPLSAKIININSVDILEDKGDS
ncbi:MAG: virulence-associated protein E [Mogibacterium sp.]|nr:virulence-associated protein E [Mogibacterium sp.]